MLLFALRKRGVNLKFGFNKHRTGNIRTRFVELKLLDAMDRDTELTNQFNSLLVEYLNTFNFIELNVGLCIRFLYGLDAPEINNKIYKMSFEKKIEYLLKLTDAEDDKKDLHAWCEDVHSKRHERNMYMHGQWAFFPHLEHGVELYIAPWVRDKYANIYPGSRFTMHKLEDIVNDIKNSFAQFQVLRRKYGI